MTPPSKGLQHHKTATAETSTEIWHNMRKLVKVDLVGCKQHHGLLMGSAGEDNWL